MKSVKGLALICVLGFCLCMVCSVGVSASELDQKISLYDGSALIDGDFAEDTVTILTRGNHLSNGIVQITDEGGRVVRVSGTTSCHKTCDKVICNLYLEQMDSNGNWYTYKYWQCNRTNVYTYSPTKTTSVAGGHWYRARGGHSAVLNGVTESVSTKTNGIWIA